jgi:hypothetical protein
LKGITRILPCKAEKEFVLKRRGFSRTVKTQIKIRFERARLQPRRNDVNKE